MQQGLECVYFPIFLYENLNMFQLMSTKRAYKLRKVRVLFGPLIIINFRCSSQV